MSVQSDHEARIKALFSMEFSICIGRVFLIPPGAKDLVMWSRFSVQVPPMNGKNMRRFGLGN